MRSKSFTQLPRFGFASPACWTLALALLSFGWLFFSESPIIGAFLATLGLLYLIVAVGAWQEKRWAGLLGVWLFAFMCLVRVVRMVVKDQVTLLWLVILFGWLAWRYWQAVRRHDAEVVEYKMLDANFADDQPPSAETGNVPPGDPNVIAGIHQARREWPTFVKAFESRLADDLFFIKVSITEGEGDSTEFVWVRVLELEDGTIRGVVANQPVSTEGIRFGSNLNVTEADVTDWYYSKKGGDPVGLFTVSATSRSGDVLVGDAEF